jgi:hypothetical protein
MNKQDFYVATSRATDNIQVVTDNKRELTDLVRQSSGEKETALLNSKDTSQSHGSVKDNGKDQRNR